MQTIPNRQSVGLDHGVGAVVIDFAAARASRDAMRFEHAAERAAAALARTEAGRATWSELAAALVAPFNA